MNNLSDAIADTLEQSERIMSKLGLNMTLGSDFEWMSILNPEAQTQPLPVIKRDIEHLYNELSSHPAYVQTMAACMQMLAPDEQALTPLEAIRHTDNHFALLNLQMNLLTLQQAANAGIDVSAFFSSSKERYYEASGAEAQHCEMATGIAQPKQLVTWINALQEMLAKNAESVGMSIDSRDAPAFSQPVTNGLHVHFGLRDSEGNNAITLPGHSHWNQLYANISQSLVNLLRDGGSYFSLPTEASYRRNMSHRQLSVDLREAKIGCVRDIRVMPENWHWEMTLAGASTPPDYAMLVPVLAMVEGTANSIGIDLTQRPDSTNILNYIEGAIDSMEQGEIAQRLEKSTNAPAHTDVFFTHNPDGTERKKADENRAPASLHEAQEKLLNSTHFEGYFADLTQQAWMTA